MADIPSKRQREETKIEEIEETKRHKSYNQILSLLEEEEEEPTQDLTSLITTLQQELSYDPLANNTTVENDQDVPTTLTTTIDDYPSSSSSSSKEEEGEGVESERVMRLLLEASDDELGIPNREDVGVVNSGEGFDLNGVEELGGVDGFVLPDGLWECEDINVDYYNMLQPELFM